jgi:hypothetical protein
MFLLLLLPLLLLLLRLVWSCCQGIDLRSESQQERCSCYYNQQ